MRSYTFTGCIAAGKTTLAKTFAEKHGYLFVEEECDKNPYLEPFYKDMHSNAEKMQMFYLTHRLEQIKNIDISTECIVQDQMMYAFGYIFPHLQYAGDILTTAQFMKINNFMSAIQYYERTRDEIIIYIRTKLPDAQKLYDRIVSRDRKCELSISIDYLKNLIKEYEYWYKTRIAKNIIEVDAFASLEDNLKLIDEKIFIS